MIETLEQFGPYVVPIGLVDLVWTRIDRVYKHVDENFINKEVCEERTGPIQADIVEIKKDGIKDPVILEFDRDGYAFLGEGNHRLVSAMELKEEGYDIKVPVRTHFQSWGEVKERTEKPEILFDKSVIDNADEISKKRNYHFNYLAPQSSVLNKSN